MTRPSLTLLAFLAACLGMVLFAVMDTAMKALVLSIGAYNTLLWRCLIGVGLGGGLYAGGRAPRPSRAALRLHIQRGIIVAGMAMLWFWAIAYLPLAEAAALSFIAPLIALYLAAVLLGERIGRPAIVASLLGIAGVVVIMIGRFGSGVYDDNALWGALAVFASAILYAYNLILARQQAQIASPTEIAFFQSAIMFATLALASPWLAIWPDAAHWPLLALAAALGTTSLLLLSWAYARAQAQVLIPVEYTVFVWLALLGWWFFDEPLTIPVLIGTALIVTGCLIAARSKPADDALNS